MRSSFYITPNHFDKICDIAVESIVQLYQNTGEVYYSDIFAYFYKNKLFVGGWIIAKNHFSDVEIEIFIKSNLDVNNFLIDFDIEKKPFEIINLYESGVFIGYSSSENSKQIPFEHLECFNISKFLYEKTKNVFKTICSINGKQIDVNIETDSKKTDDVIDLVNEYFELKDKNGTYEQIFLFKNILVNELAKKDYYKSDLNYISNTYGPRVPYGNTNFVGLDLYRNKKITNLIAREIAKKFCKEEKLNYCEIEISYKKEKNVPIQFMLKGNQGGIYLENGTFLKPILPVELIDMECNKILENISKSNNSLIEMAKWSYI